MEGLELFRTRWLLIIFVLLASGCHLLGPEYRTPQVNTPEKWPQKYAIQSKKPAFLPELYWWKQFKNAELDAAIQKALCNNYQIQLSMAAIEAAQGQLQQVKLSWLPILTALAGYSQFPVLGNPGTTFIAYPSYIINFFQLYNQQKSARAMLQASLYAKDSARLVVIAQTSASFFTLLAQTEALDLLNQLQRDYRTYLRLTQSQYHSDLISLDEINQIKSQIKQIESQITVAKNNIVVSKNALHFLFNENPGEIAIKTRFKNINSNKLVPGNLPSNVICMRPDIREVEAMLRASHADVNAVKASLIPGINLGAFLGAGSNIPGGIHISQAYFDGPIVDLPLFAQIKVSKAQDRAMYIKYVTAIREALREVANGLSTYSANSKQLRDNQSALNDEEQLCHLAKVRYRNDIDNYTNVIKCQIKLDEYKLLINHYKLEKLLSMVTLYQELGGGYRGH